MVASTMVGRTYNMLVDTYGKWWRFSSNLMCMFSLCIGQITVIGIFGVMESGYFPYTDHIYVLTRG